MNVFYFKEVEFMNARNTPIFHLHLDNERVT